MPAREAYHDMDAMMAEREIVRRLLEAHAAIPYAYGDVRTRPVFDEERGDDALLDVGWEGAQRVHGCLVHLAPRDGKVWVEYDGTEDGIANTLVAAGIPKERIVLAFHRPEVRAESGFAVA